MYEKLLINSNAKYNSIHNHYYLNDDYDSDNQYYYYYYEL